MFLKVSNSEARFHPNIKKGYKVQLPTRQLFILSTVQMILVLIMLIWQLYML